MTRPEIHDLRGFLAVLREHHAINEIRREVDPVHELGRVLRACEQAGKAAYFHRVKGHDIPVVGGALGTRNRIALALGCAEPEVADRVRQARAHPIPPEEVAGDPVCREHVVTEGIDLATLPVPTHAPLDAAPFINAGAVIARDPETGRHNLSFNRLQLYGSDLVGVNMNAWRDMMEFFRKAEAADENLPFAVAVGLEPSLLMAAAFRYEGDEYEVAGALRGSPEAGSRRSSACRRRGRARRGAWRSRPSRSTSTRRSSSSSTTTWTSTIRAT